MSYIYAIAVSDKWSYYYQDYFCGFTTDFEEAKNMLRHYSQNLDEEDDYHGGFTLITQQIGGYIGGDTILQVKNLGEIVNIDNLESPLLAEYIYAGSEVYVWSDEDEEEHLTSDRPSADLVFTEEDEEPHIRSIQIGEFD